MVAWAVLFMSEFEAAWSVLDMRARAAIGHDVGLLERFGPHLGRPYADTVAGSRFPNMKELRTREGRRQFRTLFAFDPKRRAVLLTVGDKSGDREFYARAVRVADEAFERHLREMHGA